MPIDISSPALAGWTDEQLRDELSAREFQRAAATLPPIGTRWGDLTEEQKRSLPDGTRLGEAPGFHHGCLTMTRGGWADIHGECRTPSIVNADRRILSYPEAP